MADKLTKEDIIALAAGVLPRTEAPLQRDELDQMQVRISVAGMPFHPGATPGVDNHGHIVAPTGVRLGGGAAGARRLSAEVEAVASAHASQAEHHAEQAIKHSTHGGDLASHHVAMSAANHAAVHALQAAQAAPGSSHATRASTARASAEKAAQASQHAMYLHHVDQMALHNHVASEHLGRIATSEHLSDSHVAHDKALHHMGEYYHHAEEADKHGAGTAHAAKAAGRVDSFNQAAAAVLANKQQHAHYLNHTYKHANLAHDHAALAETAAAQGNLEGVRTHSAKAVEHGEQATQYAAQAANHGDGRVASDVAGRARGRAQDARQAYRNALDRHGDRERRNRDVSEFFGADKGVDADHLQKAFSAPGHFEARPTRVTQQGNQLALSYDLHAADGKKIGQLSRTFTKLPDGGLKVYHAFFQIDSDQQGQGSAKKMFKTAVEAYQKVGVKEIGVTAGLSKGRYVWASFGFKATPSAMKSYKADFKSQLEANLRTATHVSNGSAESHAKIESLRGALAKVASIKNMQHLADFEHNGVKYGKNYLTNAEHMPMWSGTITVGRGNGWKRLKQKIGMT